MSSFSDGALSGGTLFARISSRFFVHSSICSRSDSWALTATGWLISFTDASMPQPREDSNVGGGASQGRLIVIPPRAPFFPVFACFSLCATWRSLTALATPGAIACVKCATSLSGKSPGQACVHVLAALASLASPCEKIPAQTLLFARSRYRVFW